ncbi:MAG TPA: hypothetical protein DCX25_00575 [Candidatus Pacebacteria bacterium]|nr:MAG: Filamentation induced by cAMP protein fic [Microgenomates group bacterium GW2011_GWB1_45_17]KKU22943.1 MAG: Filamentation induced by cAMP protein fic [Microgenomates group bacterium GW2011_GWA1_46_15]KKU24095.1 MAG: Filamentation induced by cAMP protein fic [Microgenomates group bacterium GW2011_GWC1_46_15]HAV14816.1 hypothetical protein [Candidatus Paceibacterota bacterium]HCR11207.1 hypothetical protein [Candidatus Paceibacterota bacterium]
MLRYPHTPSPNLYQDMLQTIRIRAGVLLQLPSQEHIRTHILSRNIMKSSLFSARIEGNTLTLETFNHSTPTLSQKKQEVVNILDCLQSLSLLPSKLTPKDILTLHRKVIHNLPGKTGFRTETTAVFDQYGQARYITPPPADMRTMLRIFLKQINEKRDLESALIHALCSHYYFEKIHPFVDGNGRTGRVLLQYLLYKLHLFGDHVLPIEEYLEHHRHTYYAFLEKNTREVSEFVRFMLDGLLWAINTTIDELAQSVNVPQLPPTSLLSPRRQEVLAIIKDHSFISFDTIARRFPSIPKRTLFHDVVYLIRCGVVQKYGVTRGASYSAV